MEALDDSVDMSEIYQEEDPSDVLCQVSTITRVSPVVYRMRKEWSLLFNENEKTANLSPSETIRLWKLSLDRLVKIYEYVNDFYQQQIEKYSLISAILGSIATTLGSIELAYTSNSEERTVTSTILILLIIVFSGGSTGMTGIINLYKWVPLSTSYTRFITEVESFRHRIIAHIYLPGEVEEKSMRFVEKNAEAFSQLLSKRPVLKIDDARRAEKLLNQNHSSGILPL